MIVADAALLKPNEAQSRFYFDEIAAFLAPEGLELQYHNAQVWLIKVDGKAKISTDTARSLLGKSILSAMKSMDKSLYWQRIMTELQMFLSQLHNLQNKVSAEAPQASCSVNGVWIYGFDAFAFKKNQSIITDDALVLAAFPQHTQRLDFDKPWDKNAILLINHYEEQSLATIMDKTSSFANTWFWNKEIYVSHTKKWWHRLVRKGSC